MVNYSNPDGTINGFGFGILDFRNPGSGDPDPLGFIYEDGEGDRITVTITKEGYEDGAEVFYLEDGTHQWLNVTLVKKQSMLLTPKGMMLISGIIVFLLISIFVYRHYSKQESIRKEAARKRSKRRRR